jgi:acetyltransferase
MVVRRITASEIEHSLDHFVDLLVDSVESGASVGYLLPFDRKLAEDFWRVNIAEVAAGTRIVIAAFDGDDVAGAVHLALAMRPNSMHRAEVQKLLVHTRHRGQGLARRLMQAAEEEAVANGRTLLILDTKEGDAAEGLYEKLGYVRVGAIPRYVRSTRGDGWDATVVFYKQL